MSKKKKHSSHFYDFNGKSGKKGKKSKNKDSGYYKEPEFKEVKPTLDKKDAKKNKKMLLAPVEIPKEFIKSRVKCNHADGLMTVKEFKAMTPTYAAFTPMLDTMTAVFGADDLRICKRCYDVIVKPELFDSSDVRHAIAVLYATANVVVSHKRMKDDEVKSINKVKMDLNDWSTIANRYRELEESGALATQETDAASLSSDDLAALNKVSSANTKRPFTV